MVKKTCIAVALNLAIGNFILFVHEVYLRKQSELDISLVLAFSIVALAVLPLAARILQTKKSILWALLLSLASSFLIPVIGFFMSMGFSLLGLFVGSIYLFIGFGYFVLPMFVLNYILFRWIQKGGDSQK